MRKEAWDEKPAGAGNPLAGIVVKAASFTRDWVFCGMILVITMLLAGCATTSPSPVTSISPLDGTFRNPETGPVASTSPFVGTWRAPAPAELRSEGVDFVMFYVQEDGFFVGSANGPDSEVMKGFTGRWTAESSTTASIEFEGDGRPAAAGRVTLIDGDTLLAVADNVGVQFTRQ